MTDTPEKDQQLAVVEGRQSELVFFPDRSLKSPKWGIWVVAGIVVLSVLGSAFSSLTSRSSANEAAEAARQATVFSDRLLAENVEYAKEVRCLRGSGVALDDAMVNVLSVFADSQTIILGGLSASAQNDPERLGIIVIEADRVVPLLSDGKIELAEAIEIRKAAYQSCTDEPLPGMTATTAP